MGRYIADHWRGRLSVAQSFWLNVVLVNWAVVVAFGIAERFRLFAGLEREADILRILAAFAALTFPLVALIVWQIVGAWRAAGKAAADPKDRRFGPFWPRLTQVTLVLVLAANIPVLADLGSAGVELSLIATGNDDAADFEVTVVENELQLVGYINFTSARELTNYLRYNPAIAMLCLESPGGRLGPAVALGTEIAERKLPVYVEVECSSACALAFVASPKRIVSPEAKLGFHRSMPLGLLGDPDPFDRMQRDYLVAHGVKAEFADKAARVPAETIWYPSFDELTEARVITHVYDGDRVYTVGQWRGLERDARK